MRVRVTGCVPAGALVCENRYLTQTLSYTSVVPVLDSVELVASIVGLRRAIVKQRDRTSRASLRDVEVRLRRALGPTIAKKRAAAALGVSVPALDKWVEQGILPVVQKPGSSRLEVEARPFLQLAERVEAVRHERGGTRTPIAVAVRSLGWKPTATGRRVLRLDVAALPRPNTSEQELLAVFHSTTPEERVRQVAELSQMFASVAPAQRRGP